MCLVCTQLVQAQRNKLESFFVPYSDVITAPPPASYSRWIWGFLVLGVLLCWLFRPKKVVDAIPSVLQTPPTHERAPEKVYPDQPLERLGVKLKDIMLEEGVSPQIVANTVAFAVRSVLHVSTPKDIPIVKPMEKREPDAKRTIIPDLPSTKPKRKAVTLEPIVEEVVVKGENPRLKKLLESRERIEEEMRSKGALDPKDPLKP